MKIDQSNWLMIDSALKRTDQCVLPLGCTEQHAYLSLSTDSILAEKVSADAAAPLEIPVFPVVPYGITPMFADYSGTVSLPTGVYFQLIASIIHSLAGQGFRRILVVNGHGGNTPARSIAKELSASGELDVKWHDWWCAPQTWAKVQEIDPIASHASWMENFAWTRLPGVKMPLDQKPLLDSNLCRSAASTKELLSDGNCGGFYQRMDVEMDSLWSVAVEETRALLMEW